MVRVAGLIPRRLVVNSVLHTLRTISAPRGKTILLSHYTSMVEIVQGRASGVNRKIVAMFAKSAYG